MTKSIIITLYLLTMGANGNSWSESSVQVYGSDGSSGGLACRILGERWLKNQVRTTKPDEKVRYAYRCSFGPDKF